MTKGTAELLKSCIKCCKRDPVPTFLKVSLPSNLWGPHFQKFLSFNIKCVVFVLFSVKYGVLQNILFLFTIYTASHFFWKRACVTKLYRTLTVVVFDPLDAAESEVWLPEGSPSPGGGSNWYFLLLVIVSSYYWSFKSHTGLIEPSPSLN